MDRKSLFASQDSEDLKLESKKFYTYQKEYIKKHNCKHQASHYINHKFLQRIVTVYQKMLLKNKKNKTIEWLFGKALDIMIRENITDHRFIRYGDEMKGCFYSYAMFRCYEYTIRTFDPEYSAFNYFTTTIRNAFKKEINDENAQKMIASEYQKNTGLSTHIYNFDETLSNDLEKDYDIPYNVAVVRNDIPMFITDVVTRYKKEGTFKQLEISLNPNEPRFKRKKIKYDYFLEIEDSGIIFKYINIFECNENKGQNKYSLQKEIMTAREHGFQTFYLFSDTYLSEDVPDDTIYNKIDIMIQKIKYRDDFSTGNNIMFDYIHKNDIDLYKIDEPNWWWVGPKLEKREISFQQIENYTKLKEVEHEGTRVWDAGSLNKKEFK